MIRKQHSSAVWYEFEQLQPYPHISHGSFTIVPHENIPKQSIPNLPSSLIPQTLSSIQYICHYRQEFQSCSFIEMTQVHGNEVSLIDSPPTAPLAVDGLITSLQSTALIVRHADCQPCLIVDPQRSFIAAIHCGWKGSCLNIYKTTVDLLVQLGSSPRDLLACIGPSLGPCHAQFVQWKNELPPSIWPFRGENDCFNFWEVSRYQLLSCGLRPDHIEIADLCTYCHSDLFYSYRRDKTPLRNITCVALRAKKELR